MAVTEDRTGYLNKIKWTWTCSSSGAYSEATAYRYNGAIVELVTIPTDGPTDDYDIAITDADGADVLEGNGANRDTTTTEYKKQSDGLGFVKSSLLTLGITTAGDGKSGVVILYVLDLDKEAH